MALSGLNVHVAEGRKMVIDAKRYEPLNIVRPGKIFHYSPEYHRKKGSYSHFAAFRLKQLPR